MNHWMRTLLVGCCCASVSACGVPSGVATAASASQSVSLPQPAPVWDEDFAARTELEEVQCAGRTILLPQGIRLPDDTRIVSATEASVVMADDDPTSLRRGVAASAAAAGYRLHHERGEVTVWVGHGMAVRLQARIGAQVLAWGPEEMVEAFSRP